MSEPSLPVTFYGELAETLSDGGQMVESWRLRRAEEEIADLRSAIETLTRELRGVHEALRPGATLDVGEAGHGAVPLGLPDLVRAMRLELEATRGQ